MTNITLSIDDDVYKKMKIFSEIKWSEFVRKCIQQRINQLNELKSDNIYADEGLLSENWLSKEDNSAWKDL
jgi:predicted CopG family antitoxin